MPKEATNMDQALGQLWARMIGSAGDNGKTTHYLLPWSSHYHKMFYRLLPSHSLLLKPKMMMRISSPLTIVLKWANEDQPEQERDIGNHTSAFKAHCSCC